MVWLFEVSMSVLEFSPVWITMDSSPLGKVTVVLFVIPFSPCENPIYPESMMNNLNIFFIVVLDYWDPDQTPTVPDDLSMVMSDVITKSSV